MSDFTVFANTQYHIYNRTAYTKVDNHESSSYPNVAGVDDVRAPPIDDFDSFVDGILLESIDIDHFPISSTNPSIFQFRGSDSFNRGPASAFTFSSSESSYDSRSIHSESSYEISPRDTASNYSFSVDLNSDTQKFNVDTQVQALVPGIDPALFSAISSPFYSSLDLPLNAAELFDCGPSFSDYGPSSTEDLFNQLAGYGVMDGANASDDQIDSQLAISSITLGPSLDDPRNIDSRKAYKCTVCTRAFDRRFNLKTHMETHNPERKKPYVCPHLSCHRAFSRKHDLRRHITSLHRGETTPSSSELSIGVGNGVGQRCNNCGKSSVGNSIICDCDESDEVK